MAARKNTTPRQKAIIRELYAMGMTYQQLADEFRMSRTSIGYIINDKFRKKRLAWRAKYDREMRQTVENHFVQSEAHIERKWRELRRDIPKGPVNLNQALLGDPLCGRSALDKKRSENEITHSS